MILEQILTGSEEAILGITSGRGDIQEKLKEGGCKITRPHWLE